jgi:hypothetical protein
MEKAWFDAPINRSEWLLPHPSVNPRHLRLERLCGIHDSPTAGFTHRDGSAFRFQHGDNLARRFVSFGPEPERVRSSGFKTRLASKGTAGPALVFACDRPLFEIAQTVKQCDFASGSVGGGLLSSHIRFTSSVLIGEK